MTIAEISVARLKVCLFLLIVFNSSAAVLSVEVLFRGYGLNKDEIEFFKESIDEDFKLYQNFELLESRIDSTPFDISPSFEKEQTDFIFVFQIQKNENAFYAGLHLYHKNRGRLTEMVAPSATSVIQSSGHLVQVFRKVASLLSEKAKSGNAFSGQPETQSPAADNDNVMDTEITNQKPVPVKDSIVSENNGKGRSKSSIMEVVMHNLAELRYTYNKRLREKPGLQGKVTVKFAIDEFGTVIFCQVVNSAMRDSQFEQTIVSKIRRWKFDKINKPGDVTEVTYPFVFSDEKEAMSTDAVSEPESDENTAAHIYIATIPPFADVYLGVQYIGRTNHSELQLPAGTHTLTFVKNELTETRMITLSPGKNNSLLIKFSSKESTDSAEVEHTPPGLSSGAQIFIASIPPVADIYLNEKLVGKTNVSEIKLPAGTHTLKFVKGENTAVKTITLRPGKNPSQMIRIP